MSRKRLLASWIGHNDMRAMALSLPAKQRDEILKALAGPTPTEKELGPIKTLVEQEQFDQIRLLSNYRSSWEKQYAAWLGDRVRVVHVDLKNPTDYSEIFTLVDGELAKLKASEDWPDTELSVHLSPGSPAMTAIWLLLGKATVHTLGRSDGAG